MKTLLHKFIKPYKGLPREIYIIFISRMVNSLGSFVYPLLTLILTQKIHIDVKNAGLFMTSISLFSAPGMLIGGKLVDTIGRKKVILIFQSLALTVFIVCGFLEPSLKMAYILMLAPIFYSFCMPAQDAMTADLTTKRNRKEAFSLLYMGHNLGFAIGPVIGGLLYKNYLSFVFFGDAFTTFVSLILLTIFVGESSKYKIKHKIKEEETLEKREDGSVFKVLFNRMSLIYFALISFIYQFAYSQWGFLLPLQLGNIFGEGGAKYFGFMAGFNGFLIISFTPFLLRLTSKKNNLKVISLGGVLYSVSFLIFSITNNIVLFFIAVAVMTMGEIVVSITTPVFISNNSPVSHRGRINAILPTIYGAGWAMGPVAMGKFSSMYGIEKGWTLLFIVTLIAAVLMRWLVNFSRKSIASP